MYTFPNLRIQRTGTVYHRLFSAILVATCLVLMLVLNSTSAQAQKCEDGNCKGIKIYNCTKYEYKIRFKLCCDGEIKVTDCEYVPADGCDGAAKFDFSPCTILKVGFCNPLPPGVGYYWDSVDCYLKIYYL